MEWKETGVAARDGSTMARWPAGLAFPAEGEDDGDNKQGELSWPQLPLSEQEGC